MGRLSSDKQPLISPHAMLAGPINTKIIVAQCHVPNGAHDRESNLKLHLDYRSYFRNKSIHSGR